MESQKKKILVIDDDECHLMATKELLENEGYNVFAYKQGFGATNTIKTLRPDLVLLDVNMPGLSGTNLVTVLQSNNITKDIPVVFYSSNDENSLREAVRLYGIRGYICKGISLI